MTELQLAIGHLKEAISVGNVLLVKLEAEQKDLDRSEIPEFPRRFFAAKDTIYPGQFVIGLQDDGFLKKHDELPFDFLGRTCFSRAAIQQIIEGLQTLLGEQQ